MGRNDCQRPQVEEEHMGFSQVMSGFRWFMMGVTASASEARLESAVLGQVSVSRASGFTKAAGVASVRIMTTGFTCTAWTVHRMTAQ